MMEAANTSETSLNFYQTTRRYTPEHNHLLARHRENLESYLGVLYLSQLIAAGSATGTELSVK
jgi:hypothetical protein